MKCPDVTRGTVAVLALLFLAQTTIAQTGPSRFEPKAGQPGKDADWWPTPQELVDTMLDMTAVTSADFVIDLGSGDGRIVISAAKRGARALGVEYDADLVTLSRAASKAQGVAGKASFMKADLFQCDLSKATVITMFLLPEMMLKLRPRILVLKPGTRIVSNTFAMGEWEADETGTTDAKFPRWHTALLWIVPAKIEGVWNTSAGAVTFKQQFQVVTGTYTVGGKTLLIVGGRLRGSQVTFSAGDIQYRAHVAGTTIKGSAISGDRESPWWAKRVR